MNGIEMATIGIANSAIENLRPSKDIIQAVAVVPMLAPIITATAPASDNNPAFTKLTTITVVALELWIIVVTKAPVKIPFIGLEVMRARMSLILLPASFWRLSLISFIPYRNIPSEPIVISKFTITVVII
jgi:hypothetical protein